MQRGRVKSAAEPTKRADPRPVAESTKRLDAPKAKSTTSSVRQSKPPAQPAQEKPKEGPGYSREMLESRLELLHLHAVHLPCNEIQKQWKANAYGSYRKRFEELQKKSFDLDEKEMEALEQRNAAAILSWANPDKEISIEQQAQKASAIIHQVWTLSAPNGRYTLVIQAFEHWLDAARRVQHQRKTDRNANTRVNIVEGLGDGWKAEVALLENTVLNAADEIVSLGEMSPGGSDLERCITAVSEMLKNMLEELDMIVSIEQHMIMDERSWIEGSISNIAAGLSFQ